MLSSSRSDSVRYICLQRWMSSVYIRATSWGHTTLHGCTGPGEGHEFHELSNPTITAQQYYSFFDHPLIPFIFVWSMWVGNYQVETTWFLSWRNTEKWKLTAAKSPYPRMAMESSLLEESMVLMMAQNFCMKNFNLPLCSSIFSATRMAIYVRLNQQQKLTNKKVLHRQIIAYLQWANSTPLSSCLTCVKPFNQDVNLKHWLIYLCQ